MEEVARKPLHPLDEGSFTPVPNGIAEKYESTAALSLRYTQKTGSGKMGISFQCSAPFLSAASLCAVSLGTIQQEKFFLLLHGLTASLKLAAACVVPGIGEIPERLLPLQPAAYLTYSALLQCASF